VFAPYCPTCRSRRLLGTGRIVAAHLDRRPLRIDVECFCGTVIAADNPEPPALDRVA